MPPKWFGRPPPPNQKIHTAWPSWGAGWIPSKRTEKTNCCLLLDCSLLHSVNLEGPIAHPFFPQFAHVRYGVTGISFVNKYVAWCSKLLIGRHICLLNIAAFFSGNYFIHHSSSHSSTYRFLCAITSVLVACSRQQRTSHLFLVPLGKMQTDTA